MRYRDSQLIGAPVVTESGASVGRLAGLIVDAETHEVIQYAVKKSGTLEIILPKEFLVNRTQVVSIAEDRIVIKDSVVTEGAEESVRGKSPEPAPKPAGLQSTMD
jgi:sporulation protein YlmC with PRC-barrel domain